MHDKENQWQLAEIKTILFVIGTDRVDIFYQVPNLSIWMYYSPDSDRVPFFYIQKIIFILKICNTFVIL